MKKYNKGSDEFYYKEIEYNIFDPVCPKIDTSEPHAAMGIVTLGQLHHLMEEGWTGWWSNYFMPSS